MSVHMYLVFVNTCNICLHVYVDAHILMTISLLPFKQIKIWLNRIIYTLLLPKVGNMTLLPNPSNIVPTQKVIHTVQLRLNMEYCHGIDLIK